MKTVHAIAAAAALLAAGSAAAMLHITNPDYVIIIEHDYSSGGGNFGGGFGADFGDGGGVFGDNGSFTGQTTMPREISCTTGGDGVCRMPSITISGRWPGEVIKANEIIWGTQENGSSFGDMSRSGDSGIYAPEPPDTPPPDVLKCIADICDTARKAMEDANTLALAQTKGRWATGKWFATGAAGAIGAWVGKGYGAAIAGGAAYAFTKELGADAVEALDQAQKSAVVIAYNNCKKKCGG